MNIYALAKQLLPLFLGLLFSPFLFGIIAKTKAFFAGRKGASYFQMYYDLFKLFKKGVVYGHPTSIIFRMGAVVVLVSAVIVLIMTPLPGFNALVFFGGDFILILYTLALGRFFLVISALDTGSSFEGMGASRELCFATFAEVAAFLVLIGLVQVTGFFSLTEIVNAISKPMWWQTTPAFVLFTVVFFLLLLIENARIPVDDPNTHLELTMIHEVMILDHSGPELALMLYASCIKMWFFSVLIVSLTVPVLTKSLGVSVVLSLVEIVVIAVAVGVVESTMARFRLNKVPQLIISTVILGALGLLMSVI